VRQAFFPGGRAVSIPSGPNPEIWSQVRAVRRSNHRQLRYLAHSDIAARRGHFKGGWKHH
jgi:hypothetical protein